MRTLGRTGIKVSPYCLGAMMFGAWGNTDHDDSIGIIHRALDAGINRMLVAIAGVGVGAPIIRASPKSNSLLVNAAFAQCSKDIYDQDHMSTWSFEDHCIR